MVGFIMLELTLQLVWRHKCGLAHFVPVALVASYLFDLSSFQQPGHSVLAASHASFAQITENGGGLPTLRYKKCLQVWGNASPQHFQL